MNKDARIAALEAQVAQLSAAVASLAEALAHQATVITPLTPAYPWRWWDQPYITYSAAGGVSTSEGVYTVNAGSN